MRSGCAAASNNPMNPGQRKRIEYSEHLRPDFFWGIAEVRLGGVGVSTPEEIRSEDAAAIGNRWDPAVPERRVAGEAVHHQHRRRPLPWPAIIVDAAVEGRALS